MATYPVINKETGETKEVVLSITEWDQWKEDNPDWERDWINHGFGGVVADTSLGDWKSKLANRNPGWKQILDQTKKIPGTNLKDLY